MGNNTARKQILNTIHKGKADKLIYILKKYPKFVNESLSEDTNHTPLIQAIWQQDYIISRILLADFNADPNKFSGEVSPLIAAAIKNDINLIDLLVQFKADQKQRNIQGLNAIDFAILYGSYHAAHLLNVKYSMKIGIDVKKYENLSQKYNVNHVNYEQLINMLANGSHRKTYKGSFLQKYPQVIKKDKQITSKTGMKKIKSEILRERNANDSFSRQRSVDKNDANELMLQLKKGKLTEKTQDQSPVNRQVQY